MQDEGRRLVEIRGGLILLGAASSVNPEETTPWDQVSPRRIDDADRLRFRRYVGEIFSAFGVNLFVDHSQIVQLEYLRAGIWGTDDTWGRMLTYLGSSQDERSRP